MRAIGASEKMPSVSAGRMSCFRLARTSLRLARDQAVDEIKAGNLRRRVEEHIEPPERRRRPAEQIIEDIDQDQAGEEYRQRYAERRDEAAGVIDQRVRPRRREDAERHRDHDGDQKAEQGQLGRCRQPRAQFGQHRLPGGQRVAEIAVAEVDDIAAELLDQRLVEAELDADFLDRLRRRRGPGKIGGRVARQRAGEQERHDHHADQARDRHRRALEDHRQHDCTARRRVTALTLSRTRGNRAGGGTSIRSRRCSSASRR